MNGDDNRGNHSSLHISGSVYVFIKMEDFFSSLSDCGAIKSFKKSILDNKEIYLLDNVCD